MTEVSFLWTVSLHESYKESFLPNSCNAGLYCIVLFPEPCSVNVMQCCSCSCSRLRQVQALLRDDVNTAPDGILCSLGELINQYHLCSFTHMIITPKRQAEMTCSSEPPVSNMLCLIFQVLTAATMKAAASWPATFSTACINTTILTWSRSQRTFQRKC